VVGGGAKLNFGWHSLLHQFATVPGDRRLHELSIQKWYGSGLAPL
jgi:hypothetical protein